MSLYIFFFMYVFSTHPFIEPAPLFFLFTFILFFLFTFILLFTFPCLNGLERPIKAHPRNIIFLVLFVMFNFVYSIPSLVLFLHPCQRDQAVENSKNNTRAGDFSLRREEARSHLPYNFAYITTFYCANFLAA